jgi:hypothetical protein
MLLKGLEGGGKAWGRGERPAAALYREAGEGLEVEDGADGRAPSVSGREGERGALVGRRAKLGRAWAGGGAGRRDWVGVFFLFFFFQIHFKPISNPFKIKSFTCFQIQILTQISPTILKAFHKPFFNNFSNIF